MWTTKSSAPAIFCVLVNDACQLRGLGETPRVTVRPDTLGRRLETSLLVKVFSCDNVNKRCNFFRQEKSNLKQVLFFSFFSNMVGIINKPEQYYFAMFFIISRIPYIHGHLIGWHIRYPISLNPTVEHHYVGLLMPDNDGFLCLPLLATRCNVQVTDPLTILTATSMTLNFTTSERGRADVGGSGGILLQSSQMALGSSKSGWTIFIGQNTVMTRRPLACKKNTFGLFVNEMLNSVA